MDDATSRIRAQMVASRAELTRKLEQLQQRVSDSIHQAKNQIDETVGQATVAVGKTANSVQRTAAAVIDACNLAAQMRQRPWSMIAGVVAVGCVVSVLGRRAPVARRLIAPLRGTSGLQHHIRQFTGLAVGAAMGTLRDLATDVVPPAWVNPVQSTINSWTLQIGGQLIHGRLLRKKETPPGQPS